MSEVIAYSVKMWKLWGEHIRSCKSHNCCLKDLVDNLDNEKDDASLRSRTNEKMNNQPNFSKLGDP